MSLSFLDGEKPFMRNHEQQVLLTDREASQYLSISKSWLRQSRIKGIGPNFIKIGRSVRYRIKDLESWVEQQVRKNTIAR